MDLHRDRPRVAGARGRLGNAVAGTREAKGEAIPAGSVWTHSLEKVACACVSKDDGDLGVRRGMREEGTAATNMWRWELHCTCPEPRVSSLCLGTMPNLDMSSSSPSAAGQRSGRCRHVCPWPPAPSPTCALWSLLVSGGAAPPVRVMSVCVWEKAVHAVSTLPGRGCAGFPGGLERRPCPERGRRAAGKRVLGKEQRCIPFSKVYGHSFSLSFLIIRHGPQSPLRPCVPLTCSSHLGALVLSITCSSTDVSSAVRL